MMTRLIGATLLLPLLLIPLGSLAASITDEVIVTAQKREQSAQDVPLSITAFTGEQLEALGTTTVRELADNAAACS